MKPGERWAQLIIAKELGKPVQEHDDNSKQSMFDLLVGTEEAPEIAIECVGAVNSERAETWNMGPAKGPLKLDLKSNWWIVVKPSARGAGVRKIKQKASALIAKIEERGLIEVHSNFYLERVAPELFAEMEALHIEQVRCYQTEGDGTVYLTMDGIGGAVDTTGSAVPEWISQFLTAPSQQDVLSKLEKSNAPTRHAFVLTTLWGAPWSVAGYLSGDIESVPDHAPNLPEPLDGVWIVDGFGKRGIRWDGNEWSIFEARGEGIEEGLPQ